MPRKAAHVTPSKRKHREGEPVGERRLMTLRHASEYLDMTAWALRERVWKGQLPVVTFPGGKKWYFDRRDLDAFVDRNKRVLA